MAITTVQVNNSDTDVYVSSGNSAITFLSLTNYSGSTVAVDINLVPAGDSVGNVNLLVDTLEIAAHDTYQLYASGEKLLLVNSDKISVIANASTAVNAVTSYTAI